MRDVSEKLFNEGYEDFSVFSPEDKEQLLKNNESFYEELARKYLSNDSGPFFCVISVDSRVCWRFF